MLSLFLPSGCIAWRLKRSGVLWLIGMMWFGQAASVVPVYRLPADPHAAVISFNIQGEVETIQNEEPALRIIADGRLLVSHAETPGIAGTASLTPKELRQLLNYIVVEHRFMAIDSVEIDRQIRALSRKDGRQFKIADAPVTNICLDLPQQQCVEFYAVDFAARLFPEIDMLQDLLAVQNRLKTLLPAGSGGESGRLQFG